MKLENETIEHILELKAEGMSSRQIAEALCIGKTTVNKYAALGKIEIKVKQGDKPRIGVVDIETSASKVYCFGRFDQNVSQNAVAEEGGKILVACWKWLGEDGVIKLYMTPEEVQNGDDLNIVSTLYSLYRMSDAVIMHNGKRFDQRMIQTRGIFHGLGILPVVKVIDTLEMAKRVLRLPSNKLDSIGAYFGLGRKIDNEGILLWVKVQEGDEDSMQKMIEYCVGDVDLLENVYFQLQSLGVNGFNAGHYFQDNETRCRACGSLDVSATNRHTYSSAGKYEELQCNNCGHVQRSSQLLNTKEKRKSLTRAV